MNPQIPEIYLNDHNQLKIHQTLEKYGVAVLLDYFTPEQAQTWKTDIINWLASKSGDLDPEKPQTWVSKNMPYGPRHGMMQSIISHAPTFFEIREALYPLFSDLWQTNKLYTSLDGASIHPPIYETKKTKDWPHIDQTRTDVKCIQGQAVLSDSTAVFRCTPGSHLKHQEILELCNKVGDRTNWCKLNEPQIKIIKSWFADNRWQIPIYSPPGSVVLWYSNTIHSAARNQPKDQGWRTTVYVCMRPTDQYTKQNINSVRNAALSGRTTNHWGTKTFPKRPGFYLQPKRSEAIEDLTDNPHQLVNDYSPLMSKLLAIESW